MLVLSRKEGEKIVINDNITITIVALHGHKVRVGIDAPREVPVHREEIQRRRDDELQLQEQFNQAAEMAADDVFGPRKRCGFVPPGGQYAACTRLNGHDGPCAHASSTQ